MSEVQRGSNVKFGQVYECNGFQVVVTHANPLPDRPHVFYVAPIGNPGREGEAGEVIGGCLVYERIGSMALADTWDLGRVKAAYARALGLDLAQVPDATFSQEPIEPEA